MNLTVQHDATAIHPHTRPTIYIHTPPDYIHPHTVCIVAVGEPSEEIAVREETSVILSQQVFVAAHVLLLIARGIIKIVCM